ncbi:MAG: beta-ketoacyl synthase N-terminal-like domain-containing protein, partial [Desulfohalobiaceae bacterium]
MQAPLNRRVFVIGYGAATPLGKSFAQSWEQAVAGRAGFRQVTSCEVQSLSNVVGEIPDWDPESLGFADAKEAYNWNADFVLLTMAVCKEALENSGLEMDSSTGPRTACLIGSALNGTDAFRKAMDTFLNQGPLRISPYLLPNLCANLPSSKAGMLLGFTGPIFSPQGACASGNHAIGLGARMIRDGDCDFVLAGGVDTCIMPEIIHGFANMNATIKISETDRAYSDPSQASRPFSVDRKGMVLSEGCGVLVLAAEEALKAHGLAPKAEVLGVGWTSDAHHFTLPYGQTIIKSIQDA